MNSQGMYNMMCLSYYMLYNLLTHSVYNPLLKHNRQLDLMENLAQRETPAQR